MESCTRSAVTNGSVLIVVVIRERRKSGGRWRRMLLWEGCAHQTAQKRLKRWGGCVGWRSSPKHGKRWRHAGGWGWVGGGGYCVKSCSKRISTSAPTSDSLSPGWISTVYSTQTKSQDGGKNTQIHTHSRNKKVSTETEKNVNCLSTCRSCIWGPAGVRAVSIGWIVMQMAGVGPQQKTHPPTFCEDLLCNSSRLLDISLRCCLETQLCHLVCSRLFHVAERGNTVTWSGGGRCIQRWLFIEQKQTKHSAHIKMIVISQIYHKEPIKIL